MARDYTCSTWTVTHGSTTVLAVTDLLPTPPTLDGGQQVQVDDLVQGVTPFRSARGNERHTLTIVRARRYDTYAEAEVARLQALATLPRTRETVTITLAGGGSVAIGAAVITTWASHLETTGSGWLVILRMVWQAGALTVTPPPPPDP